MPPLFCYHISRMRAFTSMRLSERALKRPDSDSGLPRKSLSMVANSCSDTNRLRAP